MATELRPTGRGWPGRAADVVGKAGVARDGDRVKANRAWLAREGSGRGGEGRSRGLAAGLLEHFEHVLEIQIHRLRFHLGGLDHRGRAAGEAGDRREGRGRSSEESDGNSANHG